MRGDRFLAIYLPCALTVEVSFKWGCVLTRCNVIFNISKIIFFDISQCQRIQGAQHLQKMRKNPQLCALLSQLVMSHRTASSLEWQHAVHTTSMCFSDFVLRSKCTRFWKTSLEWRITTSFVFLLRSLSGVARWIMIHKNANWSSWAKQWQYKRDVDMLLL